MKISILAFFLLAPCILFAQKRDSARRQIINSAYGSFGFGPSYPLGAYGNSVKNGKYGAVSGGAFSMSFVKFFSLNAGIGLSLKKYWNRVDSSGPMYDPNNRPLAYHVPAGSIWNNTSATIGPVFSLPFRNFAIDMSFQGGILGASAPGIDVWRYSTPSSKPDKYGINYGLAHSFVANTGIQLRLRLEGGVFLMTSADYQYSRPTLYSNNAGESRSISVLMLYWGLAFGDYLK